MRSSPHLHAHALLLGGILWLMGAPLAQAQAEKPDRSEIIRRLRSLEARDQACALLALARDGSDAAVHLPEITAATADENPVVRAAALQALQAIGEAARVAAPAVAPLLNDPEEGVRLMAASALAQIMDPHDASLVPDLARALRQEPFIVRQNAAFLLGRIGAPARLAGRALGAALGDSEPTVRLCVAQALRRIRPPLADVLEPLRRALADPSGGVVVQAANALGEYGSDARSVEGEMTGLMASPHPAVRRAASWALGCIGPRSAAAVRALAVALDDDFAPVAANARWTLPRVTLSPFALLEIAADLRAPHAKLREHAAYALGWMGAASAGAAPAIVPVLDDADADARWAAAWALLRGGGAPDSAPRAMEILLERDHDVSSPQARLLLEVGPGAAQALEVLREHLRKPPGPRRWHALMVLAHLGPAATPLVPELHALVRNGPDDFYAIQALGNIGPPALEAAPTLRTHVERWGGDIGRRLGAAYALLQIQDPESTDLALRAIREATHDEGPHTRRWAEDMLANLPRLGTDGARTLVRELVEDDVMRRSRIVDSLLRSGESAVPALQEALSAADARIRCRAAGVLGRLGKTAHSAADALVTALGDSDPRVRGAAAWALATAGVDPDRAIPALVPLLADAAPIVRCAGLEALADYGLASVRARDAIVTALEDPAAEVREAARAALAAADGCAGR